MLYCSGGADSCLVSSQCRVQSGVFNWQCAVAIVQFGGVWFVVYSLKFEVYIVQCSVVLVCSVQCAVCSAVQCS